MKTAISVPDGLYAEAEAFAQRTGRSRSRLYSEALRAYLNKHNPAAITEAINRLADEGLLELDPFVAVASGTILRNTEW